MSRLLLEQDRLHSVCPAQHRCREIEAALSEALSLHKLLKLSRQKFADRFGLDARALQDWEQDRRVPDHAARVLLTVIDCDPEAVIRVPGQ
ncbi:MAG: transcriptional regulator [Gammaproteobacteria bacterium]|nr:transcriptional regulator [Gammaproteobacteria bacterium]